jgi:WD40 repeat protein
MKIFFVVPVSYFVQVIKTHTKFVQDLRYARGGNHFASVGADAKAFLYDGKTGDVLGEFEGDLHTGNIVSSLWVRSACAKPLRQMALSWVDDQSLATASLDSTVKLCM